MSNNSDLEIASDESDFEEEGQQEVQNTDGPIKITHKLLRKWEEQIQTDRSTQIIKTVVEVFHATLESVETVKVHTKKEILGGASTDTDNNKVAKYKVEGAAIFNGVIQLCMTQLPGAFNRFLNLNDENKYKCHKAKRFPKIKGTLKSYLSNLIKLLKSVTSSNVIGGLLKHLHAMIPFTLAFSSLQKPLMKVILSFWSSSNSETVRVVAFMNILKIAVHQKSPAFFHTLLKTMYIEYVKTSKFVSPNTVSAINFMRRSLAEIYLLHTDIAYHNAFMYIRQLAILLRNALTLKKQEHFQAINNWQYINSLWFWAHLIPQAKKDTLLRGLEYPLVQVIIGVVNVIPTSQYYPLRFHCARMLTTLSKNANLYIPTLPLLTQVLEEYDFNKKHKIVSMKPMSLTTILRASKSQLSENGFKDALIENIYELILEITAIESHRAYFPDFVLQLNIKLRAFHKKCRVANYSRKIKQLLEKIEENSRFIMSERATVTLNLKNTAEVEAWEKKMLEVGTPLNKFFESWNRVQKVQKRKRITENEENAAEFKMPQLKRKKTLAEE
ncbi:nucleolar complex protein 2 homolog [Trichogramma pretiosum]|uniref:nucleolar complex protein 2 homolog n=1 Tax=Trichogramma pretiosum TaxID=7493 RepID=UPI0006C9AA92|nr:nucleolar complex protein 2 homolog [Trichogramma pretiosum]